jgi:hypothetical protein
MDHELVLPECEVKFRDTETHIEEGKVFRDMIVKHEAKLKYVCADIGTLKNWIFGSSAAIILTIVLASLGLAVTWGRTLEKVERLDRIHQGGDGGQASLSKVLRMPG